MFCLLTALKDDLQCLKVVFELIRQISGNGLLKITLRVKKLTQGSLMSPSKSSSSFNTRNSDSTSSIKWARNSFCDWNGTRPFGPVEIHSTPRDFRTPARKILVQWIAPNECHTVAFKKTQWCNITIRLSHFSLANYLMRNNPRDISEILQTCIQQARYMSCLSST